MKKVNWIFEPDLFDEYQDKLIKAINNNGSNCILYDDNKIQNMKTFLASKLFNDDIVIYHGSFQLANKLLRETAYYPCVYLTKENYECYKYYGYYGNYLLNNNYLLMGLNDILRNKEKIFDTFNSDKIFIRPSNGYKSFTGQCLPKDNFIQEFNILTKSYGGLDMDTLVLLSPAIELEEEFRFIIVDNKIISGALYMDSIKRKIWEAYYDKPCEDINAYNFAEKLLSLYEPDKCYTMDICKTIEGEYKLLEINSFCCANMYGNDYDKVVKAVNEICLKDYYDIFMEKVG